MSNYDPGFRATINSLRAQDAARAEQQRLAKLREAANEARRARRQSEANRLQTLAGERVASIAAAVARSALQNGIPFDLRVYTRIRTRPGWPPEFAEGSRPIGAWFLERPGPPEYVAFDGPRSPSSGYVLDREGSIRSIYIQEGGEGGRKPAIAQMLATEGLASFEPLLARFVIDRGL